MELQETEPCQPGRAAGGVCLCVRHCRSGCHQVCGPEVPEVEDRLSKRGSGGGSSVPAIPGLPGPLSEDLVDCVTDGRAVREPSSQALEAGRRERQPLPGLVGGHHTGQAAPDLLGDPTAAHRDQAGALC